MTYIARQIKLWWQRYVSGELNTPQKLYRAAVQEAQSGTDLTSRFFGAPADGEAFDAPQRLRNPAYFNSNAYLKSIDRANWLHSDPRLMLWAATFIEMARKRGIPLYVHCALRDEAEQTRVFKAGHSKVQYPRSAHNIGEAVDIVHSQFHWEMSKQEWYYLHTLGLRALDKVNAGVKVSDRLHLTWGGNFKSLYDPAHWEITDYRARIKRLPAGEPIYYTPRKILSRAGVG